MKNTSRAILLIIAAVLAITSVSRADEPKAKPSAVISLTELKADDLRKIDPKHTRIGEKNPSIDQVTAKAFVDSFLPIASAPNDKNPIARTADDEVIIHIVRWKVGEKKPFDQDKQNWFIFNTARDRSKLNLSDEEFQGTRLWGKHRLIVLTIYYGAGLAYDQNFKYWDVQYELEIEPIVPTPLQHLRDFLGGAVLAQAEAVSEDTGAYGAALFEKIHTPSKLTVNESAEPKDATNGSLQDAVTATKEYANEGRYIFDFSAGLPVNGIKELQYSASDGIVRTRETKRENAYGFLNLFFRPQDASSDSIFREPHLVLGVPISGKPLDRPVIGLGMGLAKKNFLQLDGYIGVVFNRELVPRTLKTGSAATENQLQSDLHSRRVRKLAIGINLPVGQFLKALKGKD